MGSSRRRYYARAEEFSERVGIPLLWILSRGGRNGLSLKEICQLAVISQPTAIRRLHELRALGLVTRTDKGRWVQIVTLVPMLPLEHQAAAAAVPPGEVVGPLEVVEALDKPAEAPQSPQAASERAQYLGAKFNLPPLLMGVELNLGPVRACVECQANTPLRYGATPVCRKCAEVWKLSKEKESDEVR